MRHIRPLTINEELFNVRDLDYVDSLSEVFQIFAYLKHENFIDRDGDPTMDYEELNDKISSHLGFDDSFEDDADYIKQLNIVKDIIKNYRYKL